MSKIEDTDLTHDRLTKLVKLIVATWDKDALVEYARECLFQDYQYDIDQAVMDANDYPLTVEELDNG